MKIIIDAQISPSIAVRINRTIHDIEAIPTRSVNLQFAKDKAIYSYAR